MEFSWLLHLGWSGRVSIEGTKHLYNIYGMVGWWEVGGMLSPLARHQIAPTAFDQKVGGHLVDN